MKRILFILEALLCILITACANDSSIGIIGGIINCPYEIENNILKLH